MSALHALQFGVAELKCGSMLRPVDGPFTDRIRRSEAVVAVHAASMSQVWAHDRPYDMRIRMQRVVLAVLALSAAQVGMWAEVDPAGWYQSFPWLGLRWLTVLGPYNEHLSRDIGACTWDSWCISYDGIHPPNRGISRNIRVSESSLPYYPDPNGVSLAGGGDRRHVSQEELGHGGAVEVASRQAEGSDPVLDALPFRRFGIGCDRPS